MTKILLRLLTLFYVTLGVGALRVCYGEDLIIRRLSETEVELDLSGGWSNTSPAEGLLLSGAADGYRMQWLGRYHWKAAVENPIHVPLNATIAVREADGNHLVSYVHLSTNIADTGLAPFSRGTLEQVFPISTHAVVVVDEVAETPIANARIIGDGNGGMIDLTRTLMRWCGEGLDRWMTGTGGVATVTCPLVRGGILNIQVLPPESAVDVYDGPVSLGLPMGSSTNLAVKVALAHKPPYSQVVVTSDATDDYEVSNCSLYLRSESFMAVIHGDQKAAQTPKPGVYTVTAVARIGDEFVPVTVHPDDRTLTVPQKPENLKVISVRLGNLQRSRRVELEVEISVPEPFDTVAYPRRSTIELRGRDDSLVRRVPSTDAVTVIEDLDPADYIVRVTSPYFEQTQTTVDFGSSVNTRRVKLELEWKRRITCRVEGSDIKEVAAKVVSALGTDYIAHGAGGSELDLFLRKNAITRVVWQADCGDEIAYGSVAPPRPDQRSLRIDASRAVSVRLRVRIAKDISALDPVVEPTRLRVFSLGSSTQTADVGLDSREFVDSMKDKGFRMRLAPGAYAAEVRFLEKGTTPQGPDDFLMASKSFTIPASQ